MHHSCSVLFIVRIAMSWCSAYAPNPVGRADPPLRVGGEQMKKNTTRPLTSSLAGGRIRVVASPNDVFHCSEGGEYKPATEFGYRYQNGKVYRQNACMEHRHR